jgi:hypothetical protein
MVKGMATTITREHAPSSHSHLPVHEGQAIMHDNDDPFPDVEETAAVADNEGNDDDPCPVADDEGNEDDPCPVADDEGSEDDPCPVADDEGNEDEGSEDGP